MPTGRISENALAVKLDAKDKKILTLLAENGRMPASEIAKRIKLSRDAAAYRMKILQQNKVILSYAPIINLKAVNYSVFHVFMLLDEKTKTQHDALIQHLTHHPNTKSVMSYTDTWDIEWTFVAKNIKEFDEIITETTTKFPRAILEKEQLAVIRHYSSLQLPLSYGYSIQQIRQKVQTEKINIDKKDAELLELLAQNSRLSTYQLGQKLKLSPDATSYRMKKLILTGVIKRFTPVYNLAALGYSWYTYAINFQKFDEKDQAKFSQFIQTHTHIIRAVKTFGAWDAIIHIVVDSPSDYHKTVKEIKNTFSDIIHRYQTWLAHHEYFYAPIPKIITINQQ